LKKLGVFARDPFVPIPVRLPFSAIGGRPKHVAFAGEDKIGVNREFEIGQARLEQIDRTAGVDRPNHPILLKRLDILHATAVEHRIAAVRHEGAIEIGAEKANF
jgi:hypothetical protein